MVLVETFLKLFHIHCFDNCSKGNCYLIIIMGNAISRSLQFDRVDTYEGGVCMKLKNLLTEISTEDVNTIWKKEAKEHLMNWSQDFSFQRSTSNKVSRSYKKEMGLFFPKYQSTESWRISWNIHHTLVSSVPSWRKWRSRLVLDKAENTGWGKYIKALI